MSTCQYPALQFNVEKTLVSQRLSMHSSMRGNWYESRLDTAFWSRQSTQNRGLPSFLGTNTTGNPHSDDVGSMTSAASWRSISAASASRALGPAPRRDAHGLCPWGELDVVPRGLDGAHRLA